MTVHITWDADTRKGTIQHLHDGEVVEEHDIMGLEFRQSRDVRPVFNEEGMAVNLVKSPFVVTEIRVVQDDSETPD